jgi:hypothetical protein
MVLTISTSEEENLIEKRIGHRIMNKHSEYEKGNITNNCNKIRNYENWYSIHARTGNSSVITMIIPMSKICNRKFQHISSINPRISLSNAHFILGKPNFPI